jgi:uncharacterized protein YndB with AHSA1/START domain
MDYRRTVQVATDPATLWDGLVDVEAWPKWTASMQRVERLDAGDLHVGSAARVKQPGFLPSTWRVTELEPGRSFTWQSSSPGITTRGEHLIANDGATTTLTLTLHQRGPLASLVGLLAGRRSRRYVDMEAEGLRRAAEAA